MKALAFIIGASVIALASCSGNKDQKDNAAASDQAVVSESARYIGVMPAADGAGIAYDLTLQPEAEAGEYFLTQQYDGVDTAIYITKGTYQLFANPEVQPGGKYYRLVSISIPDDTMYFAIATDTTLTMLTPQLTTAPSGLGYVLTKTKE